MDATLDQLNILSVLISLCIFVFMLYPRFNSWPDEDNDRLIGKPSDYINRRRYVIYTLFYLATFALFAVVIGNFKELEPAVTALTKSIDEDSVWITLLSELFGERSFVYCLALVTFSLILPAIDKIDQRWRSVLLTHARIPGETLDLKNKLLKSLPLSKFNKVQLEKAMSTVVMLRSGVPIPEESEGGLNDRSVAITHLLVKVFYIINLTRTFDPNALDQKNIEDIEDRLKEIAAVSQFIEEQDTTSSIGYKNKIESKIHTLLEILARNSVKMIPNETYRYTVLSGYGFNLDYSESHRIDLIRSSFLCILWIGFTTTLSVLLFLQLFDVLDIKMNPSAIAGESQWLTQDRLFHWSFGGAVSYSIAFVLGVFFYEVAKKNREGRDLSTYVLAFGFAALGSCIFYNLANETFRWPFVWLAISFGLLSLVAVESRGRDLVCEQDVLKQALALGCYYALASGVLQVLIRSAFAHYTLLSPTETLAFFLFGTFRGGLIAFLISYTLLEAEMEQICRSKRRCPRLHYRKLIDSVIEGKNVELVLRDISEQGALVKMTQGLVPNKGDTIDLSLGFMHIKGQIIWVKKKLARVRFNVNDPNLDSLRSFINSRMKEAYSGF